MPQTQATHRPSNDDIIPRSRGQDSEELAIRTTEAQKKVVGELPPATIGKRSEEVIETNARPELEPTLGERSAEQTESETEFDILKRVKFTGPPKKPVISGGVSFLPSCRTTINCGSGVYHAAQIAVTIHRVVPILVAANVPGSKESWSKQQA